MSSLPGLDLEHYVMWNHDLIIDDDASSNASLQIAEALGANTKRRTLTAAQFAPILELYEPYREGVESALDRFDADSQSWRDYSCVAFDFIPGEVFSKANELIDRAAKEGSVG